MAGVSRVLSRVPHLWTVLLLYKQKRAWLPDFTTGKPAVFGCFMPEAARLLLHFRLKAGWKWVRKRRWWHFADGRFVCISAPCVPCFSDSGSTAKAAGTPWDALLKAFASFEAGISR